MDGEPWGPGVSGVTQNSVEIVTTAADGQTPSVDNPAFLLVRMRAGDRSAAAEFIAVYGPQIRRRIRGKLGPTMRRLFDSQEILSTLGRRLDNFVHTKRLRADSVPELWALVLKIADNSLLEKARVYRALQRKEGEDSPFATQVLGRLREAETRDPEGPELEIAEAMSTLEDKVDREVLSLWLLGVPHIHIAETLGMEPPAVRKRWQAIRERLRVHLETEAV